MTCLLMKTQLSVVCIFLYHQWHQLQHFSPSLFCLWLACALLSGLSHHQFDFYLISLCSPFLCQMLLLLFAYPTPPLAMSEHTVTPHLKVNRITRVYQFTELAPLSFWLGVSNREGWQSRIRGDVPCSITGWTACGICVAPQILICKMLWGWAHGRAPLWNPTASAWAGS